MNFNDIAIVSVKGSDYRIQFWYMNKDDAINIEKENIMETTKKEGKQEINLENYLKKKRI